MNANPISLIIDEGANIDAVLDAMLNEGFVSDTASHAIGQALGQTGANVASYYVAKAGVQGKLPWQQNAPEQVKDLSAKGKVKDFLKKHRGKLGLTAGLALMAGKNKLTKRQLVKDQLSPTGENKNASG